LESKGVIILAITYNLIEALTFLRKNPKARFKRVRDLYHATAFLYTSNNCDYPLYEVCYKNGKKIYKNFFGNTTFDDQWELVQTPVPWQEAIRAWAEGCTVRCVLNPESYPEGFLYDNFHFIDKGLPLTRDAILKGTWYIEGEPDA